MDKFEYELKVEQIEKLVAREDYSTAKKIADSMEWKKEKDPKLLSHVAELYAQAGDIDKALKIYNFAYNASSRGLLILERMTELAIIFGQLDLAEELCEEYRLAGAYEPDVNMFKYQISEGRGEDYEKRIPYLEKYCESELDEEAMYQLAWLYDRAGRVNDCVKTCDFIIDYFCFGECVDHAIALKLNHAKLTEYQERRVTNADAYKQSYESYLKTQSEDEQREKSELKAEEKIRQDAIMEQQENDLGKQVSEIVEQNEREKQEINLKELVAEEEAMARISFPTATSDVPEEKEEEAEVEAEAEAETEAEVEAEVEVEAEAEVETEAEVEAEVDAEAEAETETEGELEEETIEKTESDAEEEQTEKEVVEETEVEAEVEVEKEVESEEELGAEEEPKAEEYIEPELIENLAVEIDAILAENIQEAEKDSQTDDVLDVLMKEIEAVDAEDAEEASETEKIELENIDDLIEKIESGAEAENEEKTVEEQHKESLADAGEEAGEADTDIAIEEAIEAAAKEPAEAAVSGTEEPVVESKKRIRNNVDFSALDIVVPEGSFKVACSDIEMGVKYAIELVRLVPPEERVEHVARVSASRVNKGRFSSVEQQLDRDILLITNAGQLTNTSLDNIYAWMKKSMENKVIFVDDAGSLMDLEKRRPKLMKRITGDYIYEKKDTAEWLDIVDSYADENNCVLADDAYHLFEDYLNDKEEKDDVVLGITLKEAVQDALHMASKISVRNMISSIADTKYDEEGLLILRDRHFL